MSVNLDFYFDFGSPNAYFAYKVAPLIEARTGVSFNYIPVLLGGIFKATNNQPPLMAFADIENKLAYDRIEMERFIARHQLTAFTINRHFPVNTLHIMRGATAAQIDGILPAYMEAVFRHMWEESRKMDDLETILAALNEAGLDGEQLVRRMQDAEVKQVLKDNTAAAVERGAFGIPTFFVNDEIYFGKDRLRDVEERVLSLQAAP